MAKKVYGDTACPSCRAKGGDTTGNHLMIMGNTETDERWAYCSRCGHYEVITPADKASWQDRMKVKVEKSPEEIQAALNEVNELPTKALLSRGINLTVATRFGVKVAVSQQDGETVTHHYYPKTVDGVVVGYKIRNLDPKYFWAIGKGSGCDFFGIQQAMMGDVFSKKLYVFEDELSAMSGFQAMVQHGNMAYRPACVALPDGAESAASAISRNKAFFERHEEIIVCMDNDDAGERAYEKIRALYPEKVKKARITKGVKKDGSPIKDANDLLMEGRSLELNNALAFAARKESPAGAASVSECLDDALKKPEYGLSYPWKGLTDLTFGLRYGDMIAVGGGTGSGKTLIAHELAAHLINTHKESVGVFMLEETAGNTLKNIAGKSAGIPFHRPDAEFDPEVLRTEVLKYDGKLHLYRNFGQNEWKDIKQCIRFWVVEHGVKFIFLDNITALVSHLSATEINSEVATIAVELSGMCNELGFTCFVFSHLNPPKGGSPHESGGQVQEVQFTGSRGLMRFSQLILGFERDKQAEGEDKNLSIIRVLKDRYFGRTGVVPTKYNTDTGRLTERSPEEFDFKNPFSSTGGDPSSFVEKDVSKPDIGSNF